MGAVAELSREAADKRVGKKGSGSGVFGEKFAPLDPLQLGPALFGSGKTPNLPLPPPPRDEAAPLLREISRANIARQAQRGRGRSGSFLSLDSPKGDTRR